MIIAILQHTPLWVFLLFGLVVALGLRQTRPSRIHAVRLIALPVAMSGLSFYGVLQAAAANRLGVAAWVAVFVVTIALGARRPPRSDVQYSPASRSFALPGSWLPLGLILTIFVTRYASAVLLALHPPMGSSDAFVLALGAISGLSSACFAARAWRIGCARTRLSSTSVASSVSGSPVMT